IPNTYKANRINITIQIPINTSRFRIPQCSTKSALERNLNAIANSKNPKITLVVVIHPPDFGRDFNIFGNSANNANGKAKATPKPVIPTVSCVAPPSLESDPANNDPKMGPVQEKETIAKVKAIKNIPITPPAPDALSILFPQECGRVNSK